MTIILSSCRACNSVLVGAMISIVCLITSFPRMNGYRGFAALGTCKFTPVKRSSHLPILKSNDEASTFQYRYAASTSTIPDIGNLGEILADDDEASVVMPASLSPVQRLGRAISFYSTVIPVFASYKSMEQSLKFRREVLNSNITEEEEARLFESLHEWGSDVITDKINELKGFYVKTGQIISTRVDIFPKQYTSKLAITQDTLDPLPAKAVRRVVRDELLGGAELGELFAEFDDEPLGSASIAQVHRARLLDGRVVAVKVQRPGIEAKLMGDIQNLKSFARLAGDSLLIDYYKIFTEIEATLKYELDFLHEAQATAKVGLSILLEAHTHKHTHTHRPHPRIYCMFINGYIFVSKVYLVCAFQYW